MVYLRDGYSRLEKAPKASKYYNFWGSQLGKREMNIREVLDLGPVLWNKSVTRGHQTLSCFCSSGRESLDSCNGYFWPCRHSENHLPETPTVFCLVKMLFLINKNWNKVTVID